MSQPHTTYTKTRYGICAYDGARPVYLTREGHCWREAMRKAREAFEALPDDLHHSDQRADAKAEYFRVMLRR